MFGITFTPAALIGFETVLAEKAQPVVDDIAKKLGSSDGPVHADRDNIYEVEITADDNRGGTTTDIILSLAAGHYEQAPYAANSITPVE